MSPRKGARRLLSADGGVWSLNIAIVVASAALARRAGPEPPRVRRGRAPAVVGPGAGLPRRRALRRPPALPPQRPLVLARRPAARLRPAVRDPDRPRHRRAGRPDRGAADRPPPAGRSRSSSTSRSSRSRTCLAVIVFHELASHRRRLRPRDLAASRCSRPRSPRSSPSLLIGAAISLSEGRLGAKALGRMLADGPHRHDHQLEPRRSPPPSIVVYDPRALPLLVVPLVTVFLAYRAYADRAPAPREPRVPLRDDPHALALARDRRRARGAARPLARGVPRRDRRDRPVPVRGQRAAAHHPRAGRRRAT